jgi:DNA-binding MarR family transcriptional regulator
MSGPIFVPPPHYPKYARAQKLVYETLNAHGPMSQLALRNKTRLDQSAVRDAIRALIDQGCLVRDENNDERAPKNHWLYRLREVRQ